MASPPNTDRLPAPCVFIKHTTSTKAPQLPAHISLREHATQFSGKCESRTNQVSRVLFEPINYLKQAADVGGTMRGRAGAVM